MNKRNNRWIGKVLPTRVKEIANKKMTLKDAQKWAQAKGMVIKKSGADSKELYVNFKGEKEATAYYTDDLADAIGTAEAMLKEREKKKAV